MQAPRHSAFVVIAEDNPLDLEMIHGLLVAEGLDVAITNNGEEVLKIVSRDVPDLILLDVMMPRLNGFETCSRLKANPATQDVPVVFMTALDDAQYRVKGFQVGAVDYVSKPFEQAEILARVRTQLSLRSATRMLQDKNARLEQEVLERAAAQQALTQAAREIERRTEELREANSRLEQELQRRESAESARTALQDQVIAAQRERLRELSVPLIPITKGVLVMPLIGSMDMDRAEQVVETALRGAAQRGAEYLIIDITGVKVADATVAEMLVRAARGLNLLGTRAVITGIGPEVARTFVELNLGLEGLVTTGTLQSGVEYALEARRRRSLRRLGHARA
jgi:DNA-binding response OmpR family regulator/anti-anti-sigma regulatory factor